MTFSQCVHGLYGKKTEAVYQKSNRGDLFEEDFESTFYIKEDTMKLMNKTKTAALFLAAAVILSSVFTNPTVARAEISDVETSSDYITLLEQVDNATADIAKNYTFTVSNSTTIHVLVLVPSPVDLSLNFSTANTQKSISAADWSFDETYEAYYYPLVWSNPSKGDHDVSLTFGSDTSFMFYIDQNTPAASISNNTIVLTKGFSQTLSVVNGKVKSWSSDNEKIAVVDKNGKVTAKNTGSAVVTATTESGKIVSCDVTVKPNTYTKIKMTFGETTYGNAYISVPKISYNKKGDLVIKAIYLNNSGHKIVRLKNVKINVKNKSGKIIGKYTLKSKKTTILQGGQKTFTYTIKKSKLKQKKTQDLRNASVSSSWRYISMY